MKLLNDLLGWYFGLAFFIGGITDFFPDYFFPIAAFGMLLIAMFLIPPSFGFINWLCGNKISGWAKAGIILLLLIGTVIVWEKESKNYQRNMSTNLNPQIVGNWK